MSTDSQAGAATRTFQTSLSHAVFEAAVVAIAILVIFVLYSWYKEIESAKMVALGSCVMATMVFLIYLVRYAASAPASITVSENEVRLEFRKQPEQKFAWKDVTSAKHTSDWGIHWKFQTGASNVLIRDDGITQEDWEAFSRIVIARLDSLEIPFEQDLLPEIAVSSDETD